jgi:cytochrome P450
VVRIAPDELAFSSAEAWTDIYCNTQSRPCMPKDPVLYQVSPQDVHSILTVPAAEDHSRYRRVLNYAFSSRSLNQQEPLILEHVRVFISKLHQHSQDGPVDMFAWYNFAISDIIGDLSFGEPFGCLEAAEYHPWVSLLYNSIRFSTYLSLSRRFPILSRLLIALIPEATARKAAEHDNVTRAKIRRRMLTTDGRPDFMQAVLQNNNVKVKGMSDAEIGSTFHLVLVAGLETTATMITAVTYLLLKNPTAMQKVIDEVRQSFEQEKDITVSTSMKLRYLMAALNEGLRMIPPTPWGGPRIVPGRGEIISGSWVPGGVSVPYIPFCRLLKLSYTNFLFSGLGFS